MLLSMTFHVFCFTKKKKKKAENSKAHNYSHVSLRNEINKITF